MDIKKVAVSYLRDSHLFIFIIYMAIRKNCFMLPISILVSAFLFDSENIPIPQKPLVFARPIAVVRFPAST